MVYNEGMGILNYLFQETVVVGRDCQFRCGFCPLWVGDRGVEFGAEGKALLRLIQEGRFYETYNRRARVVNVVGGEVFLCEDLLFLLDFLKGNGHQIRLWSNGGVELDSWEKVVRFVDSVVVYFPSSEAGLFRDLSGLDGLGFSREVVGMLKSEGVDVACSYVVNSETIGFVPEMYEMTYGMGLPLYLHVRADAGLSAESKRFLSRFYRVKDVLVFWGRPTGDLVCGGFPFWGMGFWGRVGEVWQRGINRVSFYYWLIGRLG